MKRALSVERRTGMKKKVYKSYEELPLMLTVPDVAAVLGVSRRERMSWRTVEDSQG